MAALALPPEGCQLGIDIGGTKMLVVAFTCGRRHQWTFPTGQAARPEQIRVHLDHALRELGQRQVNAIGFAVPGLLDPGGTVRDCDVLPELIGWNPRAEWPTAVALNDGEAALVTVAADEPPDATVAAVGCGTGVVAALQVAGRRLRQYRPYSGELGFAPCGPAASVDELASGASLVRRLGLDPREITARLAQHDPVCERAIREAGEAFGLSLLTVMHLVHPARIGLYGGTLRYPGYLDAALQTVERRAHPLLLPLCRIERMPETELVVALGALRAALEPR